MTNINVRVVGTANVTGMTAPFGKLEAAITAVNAQLAKMVSLQNIDPKGYERMAAASALNSKMVRAGAASTGMFEVQQLKLNKATDDYITGLQKQKMSFREMLAQRKIGNAALKEQIALQNMMVKTSRTGVMNGKTNVDTFTPNVISADKMKMSAQRLQFMNQQLKSGATQMVNWGKNTQWAGRQLSVGFTMPLVAVGAAAGVMAYQVDQALTRVAKVYNTTAQSGIAQQKELDQVRSEGLKTAMNAAQQYGAVAQDTLNVQAELAAAGERGNELQATTTQVMRISRLGELDYADAIKTTISLQSVFNQSSTDLTKTFNYMNAIENATSLQTADFAKAIPIAAAPVKAFGGDIQELGVLLTAMKSRGIEATQGANAIKAAMQRLGRPSKQVQQEWTALTNTDITKIFDKSKNLIDLFSQINDATDQLSSKDKIKAFSGLFGTYQVTRMMALVNGMQDLKNGVGQVSTAYKIAEQDSSKWSKVAATEMERYQNSISGKWDIAIADMKLQLSTLGKPFVIVATDIIGGIADLIRWINKLPQPIKVLGALGITAAAIAGPLVMLTGLTANMVGQFTKGFTIISSLVLRTRGHFELLTTSQRAAKLAAEQDSVAVVKEASDYELLALAIQKVAAAQEYANAISVRNNTEALRAAGVVPTTNGAMLGPSRAGFEAAQVANATGAASTKSASLLKNYKGVAAQGALAAVSVGAMTLSSNHFVDNLAQAGLMLSLFGGPIWGAAKALGVAGKAAVTAAGAAEGIGASLSAGGSVFAAELGTGLVAATGIGAAVAVIGGGAYLWWKHEHAITLEKRAQNLAMYKQTDLLSEALNIESKRQKTLSPAVYSAPSRNMKGPDLNAAVSQFQNTDEGKNIVAAYLAEAKAGKYATTAANEYYNVLTSKGGNAKKALMSLTAMFIAAGDTIDTADMKARAFAGTLEHMDARGAGQLFGQNFLKAATTGDSTSAGEQGYELGKMMMDAMARASTEDAPHLFDSVQKTIKDQWKQAMAAVEADPVTADTFKAMGINSQKEFQQAFNDFNNSGMSQKDLISKYNLTGTNMANTFSAASIAMAQLGQYTESTRAAEGKLVEYYVTTLHLSKDINTLAELRNNMTYKLLFINKQNEASLRAQMIAQRKAALGEGFSHMLDQMGLLRPTLKGINDDVDHQIKLSEKANGTWVDANHKAKDLANTVKTIPPVVSIKFSMDNMVSVYQSGMQNVQQSIANDMSASFDSQMQNALDSRQKMWDNREAAQSARFDAQSRAFDNRWSKKKDAAEAMWDARIKKIQEASKAEQKASDARDKMFDDEMARLKALADMANNNIDFNTAINQGQFDEAAKIRNDANAAAAQSQLEKDKQKADDAAARRIDALSKKEDRLNKQKDKYMKALDAREAAEKAHMDRMHTIQENALKAQADSDTKAYQAEWDARKASLDSQLQLFMDFIAGNQQQLKKHMADVGLSYDQFQKDVIEPKGKTWGQYFGEQLHYGIRDAGLKIASDQMWTKMGQSGMKSILAGMGFPTMHSFKHFVMTGELGSEFGKGKKAAKGSTNTSTNPFGTQNDTGAFHTGGVYGKDKGGRGGRTGGLRPDEGFALLKHGETVVNEAASKKYRNELQAMNAEGLGIGGANSGSAYPGMAGLIEGTAANMFLAGTAKGMTSLIQRRIQKSQMSATKALSAIASGPGITGGFVPGPGGKHRPVPAGIGLTQGLHDVSTGYAAVDFAAGIGTPAYAVGDGVITRSEAITSGGSPGNGLYSIPYRSYGNVEYLKLDGGPTVLYAHLDQRLARAGQRVTGGSLIGRTGNTGNSTGPHLHFGDSDGNPYEFLKKGGTIKWDNTPAMLHKNERVLSAPLTSKLDAGIENIANGAGNEYNVKVNLYGSDVDADDVAKTVITQLKAMEARRPRKGRRD